MSSLLPVLREDVPQMSLCRMCPKPGSCCRGFILHDDDGSPLTVWKSSWREDTAKAMGKWGLPFRPAEINEEFVDGGEPYVTVRLDCPKLGADGRCTIYDKRPAACRNFMPGSDVLCVFFEGNNDGMAGALR